MFDAVFDFIETAPVPVLIACGIGLLLVFGFVFSLLTKLEHFWNYVFVPTVVFALIIFGVIFYIRNFM